MPKALDADTKRDSLRQDQERDDEWRARSSRSAPVQFKLSHYRYATERVMAVRF